MQPDPSAVRRWVEKAEHDRRTAVMALTADAPITDVAGFHCQQAAEKLLKAFLVFRGQEFEKIHDLEVLTNLCAKCDESFTSLLDRVEPLTAFAVQFRYPGPGDPTVDEVREALEVVRHVWDFVLDRLPPEVRPGPSADDGSSSP